jgi:hypothetical protein
MLVITEAPYLIDTRLGWQAEVRFLGDLPPAISSSSRCTQATDPRRRVPLTGPRSSVHPE